MATISRIEEASNDSQKCWDIVSQGADTLFFWDKVLIDGLIGLLSNPDSKAVALASLYLGLLHEMGLEATKAIESVRQAKIRTKSQAVVFTVGLALAMLGDSEAVQIMSDFMRKNHIPNIREFNRGGTATAINIIATGREPG